MTRNRSLFVVTILGGYAMVVTGWFMHIPVPQDVSPSVSIKQQDMDVLHEKLAAVISSTPDKVMTGPGLVSAVGGARVKLLNAGPQEIIIPLPQLSDSQVPLSFLIRSTPRDAVVEYRIQRREKLNDIVSITLNGERNQQVRLEWSTVVLIAGKAISPQPPLPDAYRSATGCVQAESPEITRLAESLWPDSRKLEEYARNIQEFIREMKPVKPPRSMDALGILNSGHNGICTANVNLAVALLRAKGISSRSLAVIPPISQRLEMHRIVEYSDGEQTYFFDPSSLYVDVPMKPWQTLIVAKSTVADEELAMKPRMSASLGCPYAQEIELLSSGITLWGEDFFWTLAKPLARFEPNDEAVSLAAEAWAKFLNEGLLSEGQLKASSASTSADLIEALQTK